MTILIGGEMEITRDELVVRRRELVIQIEGVEVMDAPSHSGDIGDLANRAQARESQAGRKARLLSLVRDLDLAIERFDAGEYGKCEDCDDAIKAARLRALPTTTTCVNCQADRERYRKYSYDEGFDNE